jgi:hypothetical protein
MDDKICKIVVGNKDSFVPFIFTDKQHIILKKYLDKKTLTNNEKVYLYSSISKKIKALSLLKQEFYIKGKNMIPQRVEKSKSLLSNLNKNAFVSGSFLYKKNFDDIDVFVLSKKRKQYTKNKIHYVFITHKDLEKPMIASAMNYCVSNFELPIINVKIKKYGLENTLLAYQMSISELKEEEFKSLKNIIMEYYLLVKGVVLDSYELTMKYEEIRKGDSIKKINSMAKDLLLKSYSKRYLYDEFAKLSVNLSKLIKKYDDQDIVIYKDFFDEIKNECRNFKGET